MLFPVAFLCLRQLQLMYIPTSQGTDFFYPYVTQILKQKYTFKDLFITHDLGNQQSFVKFLLNSQKYQIPKWKKKEDDNSHAPLSLFLEGGRERTLGTSLKCMYCTVPCSYFYRFGTDFYKISQFDKSICEEIIYFTWKHQKLQFCVP